MIGIYRIRNITNERAYVGSAINLSKRWVLHQSLLRRGKHHAVTLQRAWLKHGPDAFVFEILELVEDALALVAREQCWIDRLNSACPQTGYNIAPKAGSSLGRKHPPEVLEKMRGPRRKTGPLSAAHKAALSASRIGNQWAKGIPKTPEHKAKQRTIMLGRKSPAVAESNRRRKGEKRVPFSQEHRANISAAKRAAALLRSKQLCLSV
jgi:group I intron endonuclease